MHCGMIYNFVINLLMNPISFLVPQRGRENDRKYGYIKVVSYYTSQKLLYKVLSINK